MHLEGFAWISWVKTWILVSTQSFYVHLDHHPCCKLRKKVVADLGNVNVVTVTRRDCGQIATVLHRNMVA